MFVPLVGDEGGVERDGFTVWIGDGDLLRASSKRRSHDEKSAGVLESDGGGFFVDRYCRGALEATAANGQTRATGCGNRGRSDGADAQRHGRELNNRESSILRGAVGGSDSEEALASFVGGEKTAV